MHSRLQRICTLSFVLVVLANAIIAAATDDIVTGQGCSKHQKGPHEPNRRERQDHHVRQEGGTADELDKAIDTVASLSGK